MNKNQVRLAVDWGGKMVGLALGLPGQKAMPLEAVELSQSINRIKKNVDDYDVVELVVGISEGINKEQMSKWSQDLEKICKITVVMVDEFESTKAAHSEWYASDLPMRRLKQGEHSLAACEILNRYVNSLEEI